MISFRRKLQTAIAALNDRGLIAEGNSGCCQSCAGYAMTERAVDRVKNGMPREYIKGCVFWHGQDDNRIDGHHEVYLTYGPIESRELGTIGRTAEEVGSMVAAAMREVGLVVEWDGDGNRRILVKEAE